MKKVLLFTLINCLMLFAIVPMNVGNKWWYQKEKESISSYNEPLISTKNKVVYSVEKDTTINSIPKKIIKCTEYSSLGISIYNRAWYESESKFFIDDSCLYDNNQNDTLICDYDYGDASFYHSISNYSQSFLGNDYMIQERQHYKHQSGGFFSGDSTRVAKTLGLLYRSSRYAYQDWMISYKYDLVAAQIDGEFIGDTTNIIVTGINDEICGIRNVIHSNYPNPFNSSTMIKFSLVKPVMGELKVYNSRGEVVKTLIKGFCNAGNLQVQFDGSSFVSGIYYYRLTTPEQSLSGKMMLLK